MGKIEKNMISSPKYQKQKFFPVSRNLKLFRSKFLHSKHFEINKLIRYETFFLQSVFSFRHRLNKKVSFKHRLLLRNI